MTQTRTIICEHCGKPFESNRKKRFCSRWCAYKYRYEGKGKREYADTYNPVINDPTKCIVCGKEFIPNRKGQQFCSSKCQSKNYYKNNLRKPLHCVVCGSVIKDGVGGTKYCSDECRDKAHTRKCEECGKDFVTYNGSRFCSQECASNAQKDKTVYACKQCGKLFHRRKRGEDQCLFCSRKCHSEWLQWQGKPVQGKLYIGFELKCQQCGHPFYSFSKDAKFCSDKCKKIWKNLHTPMPDLYVHECQHCGEKFVSYRKNQKYCSQRCQDRALDKIHEIKRRTRSRFNGQMDYGISLKKLVERDHGICAICGEPVDMKSDKNSDYYGSIDHIIPLAKGGPHTWDNVQLAHRICNSIKTDKL